MTRSCNAESLLQWAERFASAGPNDRALWEEAARTFDLWSGQDAGEPGPCTPLLRSLCRICGRGEPVSETDLPLIEQACRQAAGMMQNPQGLSDADRLAGQTLLARLEASCPASALDAPICLDLPLSADPAGPHAQDDLPPLAPEQLLGEYADSAADHLATIQNALIQAETSPLEAGDSVDLALRAFHTLKGSSALLGLTQMERIAHGGETLLTSVRDGKIPLGQKATDLVLEACDLLGERIERIERSHEVSPEASPQIESLIARLEAAAQAVEILPDAPRASAGEPSARAQDKHSVFETGEVPEAPALGAGDTTVRVSTARLDALVDLVGELIITHSLASENPQVRRARSRRRRRSVLRKKPQSHIEQPQRMREEMSRLAGDLDASGKLIAQLHDLSVSLRMIPLRGMFDKAARLVRDISRKNGKQMRLKVSGEETELDRGMVEMLADPMLHMIRNAAVHGLESPEIRRQAGKPACGTLRLSAWNQAGEVIVSLSDDGKGLDVEQIRLQAQRKQLVPNADALSEVEVQELIFHPGFSTAEEVDALAGRGVGMDVVRRNVQAMRGRIEIHSRREEGTEFRLCLPMTTAVEEALVLRAGGQRFLLATRDIQQTLPARMGRVEGVGDRGQMLLLGEEPVVLHRLAELCGIDKTDSDARSAQIVIVRQGRRRLALLVDALLDHKQVVIKPLGRLLSGLRFFSSGAVLGDGQVALALDARAMLEGMAGGEEMTDPRAA
jgi:two-component system chemotaxis sensor kinase CheA